MASRSLLRKHIEAAWVGTIKGAYCEQLINSERGLQVHFCHLLLTTFKKARLRRRIFVEPCFVDKWGKIRCPDVVICNSLRIIGIVEFKYLPRGRPSPKKDLQTLRWFSADKGKLTLSNERHLGAQPSAKSYALAPDAVLCWAAVYRHPQIRIEVSASLGTRLLCLHAMTSSRAHPQIITSWSHDKH